MYKKNETESLTKRHFAGMHSRVQNKYEQMQKRLEKSKSLDSLTMLNEDFVFVQVNQVHGDAKLADEADDKENKDAVTFNVIVEEVPDNDSLLQEADESYVSPSESEKNIDKFFDNDFLSGSVESLNEFPNESTEYEESLPPPSPTPKISIRDRLRLARERRRDKNKNKDQKEKNKECKPKVEKLIFSNTTKQEGPKIPKKINKLGTVTIALIESTGFETDPNDEKTRLLSCRFRLGSEKFKSKPVRSNASKVKWQELFNINLYEENMLEISLWDKDIFLGRSIIDLSETEREKTHKMQLDLEGAATNIQLFILLTISGINVENVVLDFDDYDRQNRRNNVKRKLAWYRLRDDYTDVGCLSIFVYGAKGLSANDTYCVLELNNDRLQTHTEYKTNDPNWMKVYSFTVTDITSILEITIQEEKKSEVVGKLSIPLLRIKNGEKKWYALKDSTQRERAKGNNPRILLEMRVTWNLARASIRVINPKEVKYLEPVDKLDRHIFTKNLSRAKAVVTWIMDAFKVIKTCFEWESRKWNLIALTVWLVMCSIFRVWMLPLLLLVPFVWYRPKDYFLFDWKKYVKSEEEVAEEQKNEKEEKTSLRQKINSLQEMVQLVQNFIGVFASYGENIKNLFNFTVPYLSCLTIAILLVVALLMFLIPVNYMFMLWGIHKFTRKIRRPNRVPNNEILDLLSRVPDDETLLDCQELTVAVDEGTDDNVRFTKWGAALDRIDGRNLSKDSNDLINEEPIRERAGTQHPNIS